ncbi:MAG: hypothetical protein V7K69_19815 [Nostoc sp.]|uniref:hypothetical protein n=1 Tax=Nostoc sp. TaxID=1180 RepID=UPI002FF6A2BC
MLSTMASVRWRYAPTPLCCTRRCSPTAYWLSWLIAGVLFTLQCLASLAIAQSYIIPTSSSQSV